MLRNKILSKAKRVNYTDTVDSLRKTMKLLETPKELINKWVPKVEQDKLVTKNERIRN